MGVGITKIKIVTYQIGEEFARQTRLGRETTQEYADRHGYEYVVYDTCPYPDITKPVAWYKLPSIKDNLAGNDWVFWLDCDCIIVDQRRKLEEWVETSRDFVFSYDPVSKVNSGCWFIRNTDFARQRLDDWFNGPMGHRWWEQYSIDKLINLDEVDVLDNLSGIHRFAKPDRHIPRSFFYQHGKHWIFHAAGRQKFGYDITQIMEFGAGLITR